METIKGIDEQLAQEFYQSQNENNRHRYIFEKYDSKTGKHICPNCKEKSFVYYVDTFNNNEIVSPSVGKCERINECKYWLTPYQYFIENDIEIPDLSGNIYLPDNNAYQDSNDLDDTLTPCDYIPDKYVKHSFKNCANSFTIFLHEYLNKDTERLLSLIKLYNIGTGAITGNVIFWQMDINNMVRTGRIMHFNDKGKRWKHYNDWAHLRVKINDFKVKQCLFGEHLISDLCGEHPESSQGKQIFVVESDKTCILLKNEYLNDNNIIVMSAGSEEGLTIDKFKVFEDLQLEITLIADVGAEALWLKKIKTIHDKLKIDIELFSANDFIMKIYNENFTLEKGEDIADYLIQKRLGLDYIIGESYILKSK